MDNLDSLGLIVTIILVLNGIATLIARRKKQSEPTSPEKENIGFEPQPEDEYGQGEDALPGRYTSGPGSGPPRRGVETDIEMAKDPLQQLEEALKELGGLNASEDRTTADIRIENTPPPPEPGPALAQSSTEYLPYRGEQASEREALRRPQSKVSVMAAENEQRQAEATGVDHGEETGQFDLRQAVIWRELLNPPLCRRRRARII